MIKLVMLFYRNLCLNPS